MREVFQAELKQVGEELVEIATLVRKALSEARQAFLEADLETAQDVIAGDARIDFMQNELDERSIDILALQSPVASDLRMIVGALRMSSSLERMGDLARHLAQDARRRYPEPVLPSQLEDTFRRMFDLDLEIIEGVIQILETREMSIADDIYTKKAEVNSLHQEVFNALGSDSWDSPVSTAVDVTLSARYLERIGDHGVSVARKVAYLVTGEWTPSATMERPTGHGHISAN
ncbi:phosphate signaling complex protein PhoU [Kocuria sp.]|uniref:phosphate signaling complex protein PhoU n=1 Tax=Kocuria sp. TaxID=1871328 RepID=UPI0026DEC584|nr:phosphate signaling complex protein PhoU [Kocuria sp.]MDO5618042.1 phosphate signaling complex protein PhoU [Kocuria sp.]